MPIVRLSGGLGNQLFQAAFALRIAKETEAPVGLDVASYTFSGRTTNRYLEISDYRNEGLYFCNSSAISARIFSKIAPSKILTRLTRSMNLQMEASNFIENLTIQHEGNLIFDTQINVKENSYFVGNFISPQYWGSHTNEVLEIITDIFWGSYGKRSECIDNKLSIHVRRGDYVNNPKARKFHGICGLNYYISNIQMCLQKYPNIHVIEIFSDDTGFALDLEKIIKSTNCQITINSTVDAKNALAEMSISKFFIGCNSTFSWWSSVLMPDRVSILPSHWFLTSSRKIDPLNFFLGDISTSDIPLE